MIKRGVRRMVRRVFEENQRFAAARAPGLQGTLKRGIWLWTEPVFR